MKCIIFRYIQYNMFMTNQITTSTMSDGDIRHFSVHIVISVLHVLPNRSHTNSHWRNVILDFSVFETNSS